MEQQYNNERLLRLKNFIIQTYQEECTNPIIIINKKVNLPLNAFGFSLFACPDNAFTGEYAYLNGQANWVDKWLRNEFNGHNIKTYLYDAPDSDFIIELH